MSPVVEIAFKLLLRIVAPIVLNIAMHIAFRALFQFFLRTGDFLIELVTLDYFRDHSNVPVDEKPLNPVPDWAAALLGLAFWCAFAAAAYLSWPRLASL